VPSILEQIARGDQRAVQRCIDEYGGLVWRLATRYLGDSRAETDDIVQEIFVALWLNAARFDPSRGSEAAFVATIAHRRLTDAQRRRFSRREVAADAATEPPARLAERAPALERDAAQAAATEAFDRLPQDERHALWMVVWGGLSHSQIAAATGSPLGTVKTRLRRALRRMYESVHALDGVDLEREGQP
jgi:RNA polymerase sigma-70 factor (ECF subfamily)